MTDDPWKDLRAVWQGARAADDAALLAQIDKARRSRRAAAATRIAVVVAGLGALAGAVAHSVTTFEAALALVIAVTIAASCVTVIAIERRQQDALGAEGQTYVRARRAGLRTEWRLVQFIWAIVGLELAFLVPWWAGGIQLHFGGFMSTTALFAWWLPIAGIAGLGAWSVRRHRVLRREWRELERLDEEGSP